MTKDEIGRLGFAEEALKEAELYLSTGRIQVGREQAERALEIIRRIMGPNRGVTR